MKMRHYLPAAFAGTNKQDILLVGAGGTGSQILTDLARMNQALISLGGKGIRVTTIDPVSYTHLTLPTIYSV